ncbi:MAG: insulinase family protein [candidate division KSB1 bacterium]|nr:insulinase family protein [candidate division KSB1 bacterium]
MIHLTIDFQTNDIINGFLIKQITPLPDLNMIAIEMLHVKTGAKLLHLYTDDTENLFSISFPTPPLDNTGVPHILEHAVLAGSRKFPVREPFFEMVKMSMATFINAMTGWDCTYYPVASNVKQDLFNLAEVYFDAVFYPLLTEVTFKREAHHLMPAQPQKPLGKITINGIVYNEMKGVFSDPESILYRTMERGLFPDTVYGRESGGDPDFIPELTYEQLRQFHQTYYHPSNSYFFFYGDIPTRDYLQFLKERLAAFNQQQVQPEIRPQPRWQQPRQITESYPIGADEPAQEKTYLAINWLVGRGTDPLDVASLYILSLILLGNEGAPLKKAIIDSHLGQDLIYSGFHSVGLETTFRVALKGSEPDRYDAFEKLVLDTLTQIAARPIEQERIDAAFQQASYHYQEILPEYPLDMMERVLEGWIYGIEPLTFVRMKEHLAQCRLQAQSNPLYFNQLIRERLLDNSHRLSLVLSPDAQLQSRRDAGLAQKLQQLRRKFSDNQMQQIAATAAEIERISGEPNSPEALATLPQLKLSDLPQQPRHIPTIIEKLAGGVDFLHNDVFSNGVNYLYLHFDLKGLPRHLWAFIPRYAEAIHKMGAMGQNYEQIATRMAASTGGIRCWPSFTKHAVNPERSVWGLRFTLKTLDEQVEPAMELLHDLLFGVDPRDSNRLHDVLRQAVTRYRTDLVHDGADTAGRHAARGFTPEAYLSELVHGLPQLTLTEKMDRYFETSQHELMRCIEEIRQFILNPARLTVSFTGSERAGLVIRRHISDWIQRMPSKAITEAPVDFLPYDMPRFEGLAGPMQVAFCVQILPAPHVSQPEMAGLKLGTRIISLEYILNEIRFKGNAYGAWCSYNGLDQEIEFASYRDPHIVRTLKVFDDILKYLHHANWTSADIDRAIISTAKRFLEPIRPKEATEHALHRHLTGQTAAIREQHYTQILSATLNAVKRTTLEVLSESFKRRAVCVVSSREKLEEANRRLRQRPLIIEDILKPIA